MRSFGFTPRFLSDVCTSTACVQMTTHSLCSVPDPWESSHWSFPISTTTAIIAAICGSLIPQFRITPRRFLLTTSSHPRPLIPPPATQSRPPNSFFPPPRRLHPNPCPRWCRRSLQWESTQFTPTSSKSLSRGHRSMASSPIGSAEMLPRWLKQSSFLVLARVRYQSKPARDLFSYRLKPQIGVLRSLVLPTVD